MGDSSMWERKFEAAEYDSTVEGYSVQRKRSRGEQLGLTYDVQSKGNSRLSFIFIFIFILRTVNATRNGLTFMD